MSNNAELHGAEAADTRFSGVLAPVVTPFNADLTPDPVRLLDHCRWLASRQAGLAVFGTNSEANSLSLNERSMLLESLVVGGIDPVVMMPGTGSCALTDCVTLTTQAVKLGCKGVLVLPPFYYKGVSDDGLYRYYAEIIARVGSSDLRIYLYHIPQLTGVPLPLSLIDRLVKDYPESVVGIKDSGGDWSHTNALLQGGWKNFRVFCGSESFLLRNMQAGGAGCISATANVNPAAIHRLFRDWSQESAKELQEKLNLLREIYQSVPMIAALKATLAQFQDDPDWQRLRPPLMPLNQSEAAKLKQALAALNFEMPGVGGGGGG
ncbi:MAG: dihydrodipicolinate synthase family protein, partial [Pseudohongiellaceae bacterium]